MIRFIAAIDEKQGIADNHGIPWRGKIPGDIKFYHEKLQTGLILMGYGVYKELTKLMASRTNYVAIGGEDVTLREGFEPITDAHKFLEEAKEDVWNIGGALLFASTLDLADELYITQLEGDFHCTKFFPAFKNQFILISESEPQEENGIRYTFQVWKRKT
jgi:dihydrofolate reductase